MEKKTGHICLPSLENQPSSTGISITRGSCTLSTALTLFPTGKHHLYQNKTDFSAPAMLCKLKRNFIAVMRLQAYIFSHCNSLILFPIFRAVGFCISKQSPTSFTQHCKLQYRSCSKTKQYEVRCVKEWLMATILCSCLVYVSRDNGVS